MEAACTNGQRWFPGLPGPGKVTENGLLFFFHVVAIFAASILEQMAKSETVTAVTHTPLLLVSTHM